MHKSLAGKAMGGVVAVALAASLTPAVPYAATRAYADEPEKAQTVSEDDQKSTASDAATDARSLASVAAAEDGIPLDEATFPDAAFRDYIYYYISGDYDKISQKDADGATFIDLSNTYDTVKSLKGIENFKNLKELKAASMAISDLDLSSNTKLATVDMSGNPLTSLNVSGLTALTSLNLGHTALTSLDLSSTTALANLTIGGTSLAFLDLSHTKVTQVDTGGAAYVGAATIEVSGNTFDLKAAYPGMDFSRVSNLKGATLDASTGVLSGVTAGTPITYTYAMSDSVSGEFQLNPTQSGTTTYAVSFDANGADATPATQVIAANGKVTDPGTPVKKGYTFLGWFAPNATQAWDFANDEVTQAVKLTAKWRANTYTVHYDANGGEGTMTDQACTYDQKSYPSRNAFTWDDHEFKGWSTTPDGAVEIPSYAQFSNLTEEDGATVTLYAVWKEIVPEVGIPVDEAHFPDQYFREWVNSYAAGGNGILSDEEISKLTAITLNGTMGEFGGVVKDLTGIEIFKNLTYLNVTSCDLSTIDFNKTPKLVEVWVDNNAKLGTIDVSMLSDLEFLSADGCNLDSIDVSHNEKLKKLYCMRNNLTSIDLSHNPELTLIHLSGNKLTSLDFTHNPKLETVSVHSNELTSIDLSQCHAVRSLFVHTNHLTSIDVSQMPDLFWLEVFNNDMASLDVTANPKMSAVKAWGNPMSYINIPDGIPQSRFDFDSDGASDEPYKYEALAPNGQLKLSSLGAGAMDPSRVGNVQGVDFDAQAGTFTVPAPAQGTDPQPVEVTYDYAINDQVKAHFKAEITYVDQYEVTFDAAGGDADPAAQAVNKGDKITRPADPVKTGYTLTGWYAAGSDTAWDFDNDVVEGPVALSAKWEANSYAIHFDPNATGVAGSMADQQARYDQALTLTKGAFTRAGYTFEGWATEPNGSVVYQDAAEVNNLTADADATVTLYAVWKSDGTTPDNGENQGAGKTPGPDNNGSDDGNGAQDAANGAQGKASPKTSDDLGGVAGGAAAAAAIAAASAGLALRRRGRL